MGFHELHMCGLGAWMLVARHVKTARTLVRLLASIVVVGVMGAGLAGCGGDVKQRTVALTTSDRGETWDAVLPSPVVSSQAMIEPGDELFGRRDATLAIRNDEPLMGVDSSWPEARRPTLDRTGRLNLWRSPESVLYFRSHDVRREYRTHYYRW